MCQSHSHTVMQVIVTVTQKIVTVTETVVLVSFRVVSRERLEERFSALEEEDHGSFQWLDAMNWESPMTVARFGTRVQGHAVNAVQLRDTQ